MTVDDIGQEAPSIFKEVDRVKERILEARTVKSVLVIRWGFAGAINEYNRGREEE